MKNLFCTIVCLLMCQCLLLSQGTNNDFDFDTEDLQFLFSKLGYEAFKFPVRQSSGELLDVYIEEYKDKQLSKRISVIDKTNEVFQQYGIDASAYVEPKLDSAQTDSVFWHRFYVEYSDTLVKLHVITHGLTVPVECSVSDLNTSNARALYDIKEKLDEQDYLTVDTATMLLFFYANSKENPLLTCPAGLSKEKIIEMYDYVVFVYIEPYTAE